MKVYKIEVEEILQKIVEVEAESLEEAIFKVQEQWYECDIELNYEDFKGMNVREYKD